MQLSQRILRETESATMAVGRRATELRAQGVTLFDLGAGEPSLPSPKSAVDGAIKALESGHTRYTAVDGLADLRDALARRYNAEGASWSGDGEVLVTVGAKSALIQAVLALVDPGSEVVIPVPCWMTLQSQVRLAGGVVKPVEMEARDGFELRAEPLTRALSGATRAVVLNSPCNPTGAVMQPDELRRLVAACAERDVVLISDETYGAFIYDAEQVGASVASLAAEFPETVLLVSAFSKGFAMTGWRLGYALGSRALISAMKSIQSHTTSNATSFAMHGAVAALENDAGYQQEHLALCRSNRSLVTHLLGEHPRLTYCPPQGAFYAFPRVDLERSRLGSSTAEIAVRLLDEQQVVVVPGEAFGAPGYLRISFAGSSEVVQAGLERISAVL